MAAESGDPLLTRGRCNFPCRLPVAAHPGADDPNIIPEFPADVKAGTRSRSGTVPDPLLGGCQELGDTISYLLLVTTQKMIGIGQHAEAFWFEDSLVQLAYL